MRFRITERLLSWRPLLRRLLRGQQGRRSPSDLAQPRVCKYDVFISFRGTDTRNTFVDHLYNHLIRKGIFVFKDDKELRKGKRISSQLVQAIRDSRVSIVVFSKDFADSTWCLDEMATISECRRELNQTVFSVFYDVGPSHVRKGFGMDLNPRQYLTILGQHPDRLRRWCRAARELGNSAGWDIRNKPEFGEIENIVQAVIKALGHKFSGSADDLIGMQSRVEALERNLNLSSENDGVRVLGICGMGGIGKTTHANVLFDRISYQFDACCFIENVSKIYRDGGATAVQKQILRQALDEKMLDIYSPSEISGIVRNRLNNRKVLLLLDNVDQLEQLEELAINPKTLCRGSRMIITTRDEHILKVYGADVVHKVPLLNDQDAHDLLCKKAFQSEDQSSSCMELIPEVLKYAECLPLAIRVMGSFLCTRDAIQWRDALDRLENNPNNKIMNVLQISIDGLELEEKEIFLHIACFFKGEREDYVKRILDSCRLHPHIGIPSLVEKSLITIRNHEIHMHEMLHAMGKKIVWHKYPEKPGRWSRLWLYKDFHHVLMTEKGTGNVEAIVLNPKEDVSKCNAEGLSKMTSLKLLILYQKNFSGNLNFLSNSLQFLLWHGYPFASLPSNFEPYFLVELNMPNSSIQRLWEGRKELPYLKRVDLSNSKHLIELPRFPWSRQLERLDLTGCTNLSQVHSSIGLLTKLAFLSLRNCSNLVNLDFGSASNLCSLRILHLSGCTKLKSTPDFTGVLYLEYLDVDGCTSLSIVHESIGALAKLRFLSLRECTNLFSIPSSINTMTSLETLDLHGCIRLANLPLELTFKRSSHLESLISLDVGFCNVVELPDAIGELGCLERLNLQGNHFVSLPFTIERLSCLAYLNLAHCQKLQSLPELPTISASPVGMYFKMASGSRDHRSGLYVFDCPLLTPMLCRLSNKWEYLCKDLALEWLGRLLKEPCHFRCGFDIVVPWNWINTDESVIIPPWFNHRFTGDSIVKIVHSYVDDNWIGFAFCVAFEVSNHSTAFGSPHDLFSSAFPHPFYLSFESEYTEERFDMPLNLELEMVNGSKYLWIIYISREHCHFVQTGARITFKASPGLMMKDWGLNMVIKKDKEDMSWTHNQPSAHTDQLVIDNIENSSSSFGLKIQLPYNWLVTKQDEVENSEAKAKENNLSNSGFR